MALQITVDNVETEITGTDKDGSLSLKQMQEAVGGLIERFPLDIKDKKTMWVNEEGLLLNLPLNTIASKLVNYPVHGNVLITEPEEVK